MENKNNKKNKYGLYTLDAYDIAKKAEIKINENGNWQAEFKINISNTTKKVLQDDNALFYQITQCLDSNTDISNAIFYVDFDMAFNKKNDSNSAPEKWKNLAELEKNELKNSVINKLRWIFYKEQGIEVSFGNSGEYKTFLPFDRSSSMTKNFKLTFIDKSILKKLTQRLILDINFESIKNSIDINKYWAYRGLYLSSGQRVEIENDFQLNEQSVIVVCDGFSKENNEHCDIFTVEKSNEEELWKPCLKTDKDKDIEKYREIDSAFDGQGLIDREYSLKLGNYLKEIGMIKKSGAQAHSYQIRLPITKGMLFEVDFHSFFDNFIKAKNEISDNKKLIVIDIYGKERDLSKAHIILTQSMFKGYKWLKKFFEYMSEDEKSTYNNDPMNFYFSKVKQYHHALYVCECDANMRNVGWVHTNKQFLSTLKLSRNDLNSVVEKHNERMNNLTSALKYDRKDYDISLDDVWSKAVNALRKNNIFLSDDTVKEIVKTLKDNYKKRICLGEMDVEGENRYFARDLMAMLLLICSQIIDYKNKYKLSMPIKCLSYNRCYMPNNIIENKAGDDIGILRNPHLSRPEQCLLKSYKNIFYQEYFGHLKNVVMIGFKSLAALTLGGADFDGDMVKVFGNNSIITKVIKKGIIGENDKRKLPIIKIPAPKAKAQSEKKFNSPSFEVVYNTFCNEIGIISNLAIRLAGEEYKDNFDEDYSKQEDKLAEMATIVTGLEIDASKNGQRPTANKKELKAKDVSRKLYFDDANKFFDNNYGYFSPTVEKGENNVYVMYARKDKTKTAFRAEYLQCGDNVPILEQLPGIYLKYLYDQEQENTQGASRKRKSFFDFMENSKWKNEIEKEIEKDKLENVKNLVQAYLSVVSFINGERKINWKNNEIDTILKNQYDSLDVVINNDLTVDDAKNKIYNDLSEKSMDNINELIEDLKNKDSKYGNWHFLSKKERIEKLKEMLEISDDDINKEYFILCNFNYGGYKLLYLFLQQAKFELEKVAKGEALKRNNYPKVMMEKYERVKEQYQKDKITNKIPKTLWNRELIQYCREQLQKQYPADISEAIKAVMCSEETNKMKFLWNVFEFNEITKFIPNETNEGDVDA